VWCGLVRSVRLSCIQIISFFIFTRTLARPVVVDPCCRLSIAKFPPEAYLYNMSLWPWDDRWEVNSLILSDLSLLEFDWLTDCRLGHHYQQIGSKKRTIMEVVCLYIGSLMGERLKERKEIRETESKKERTRKLRDGGEFQLAHLFRLFVFSIRSYFPLFVILKLCRICCCSDLLSCCIKPQVKIVQV
jgi:hypothetical protein